jgi:hypothetical protein
MKIEPQDYLQKLVEVYQAKCNQYLQERISLQAQLDLVLKELEKVEVSLQELENREMEEVVDVNTNTGT